MEFLSRRSVSFESRLLKSYFVKCDLDGNDDDILLKEMTKGDEKRVP